MSSHSHPTVASIATLGGQPGAFRGAIRVLDGKVDGLKPQRRRGYGRWVRDVLVWTKRPLLFGNDLVSADGLDEQRPAVASMEPY
jgi:hypothetical protein